MALTGSNRQHDAETQWSNGLPELLLLIIGATLLRFLVSNERAEMLTMLLTMAGAPTQVVVELTLVALFGAWFFGKVVRASIRGAVMFCGSFLVFITPTSYHDEVGLQFLDLASAAVLLLVWILFSRNPETPTNW